MPNQKRKKTRYCLICAGKTTSSHLGIDACRACAVFHRRTSGRKLYPCRSNTNNCPLNREFGVACRRCRFERIERILANSRESEAVTEDDEGPSSQGPSNIIRVEHLEEIPMTACITRSLSSENQNRSLLAMLRAAYESMCFTRRTSELSVRANPPHPMQIYSGKCPFYPATFATMNHGNRVLLTAVLEFATTSFTEFSSFAPDEQWKLAVAFFYRFRSLDSCYRAGKEFPNDLNKAFGSYTAYLSEEVVECFFDDMPNSVDTREAKIMMLDKVRNKFWPARLTMKRLQPDEEEFFALCASLFWRTDGFNLREEISNIADTYQRKILEELQAYYRDVIGIVDYAARLGALFALGTHFDRAHEVHEQFEILRLLDVVSDDNFMYSLQQMTSSLAIGLIASIVGLIAAQCNTSDHPSCAWWEKNNQFCTNTGYALAMRQKYCPFYCKNLGCKSATATTTKKPVAAGEDTNVNCKAWSEKAEKPICAEPSVTVEQKTAVCAKTCAFEIKPDADRALYTLTGNTTTRGQATKNTGPTPGTQVASGVKTGTTNDRRR